MTFFDKILCHHLCVIFSKYFSNNFNICVIFDLIQKTTLNTCWCYIYYATAQSNVLTVCCTLLVSVLQSDERKCIVLSMQEAKVIVCYFVQWFVRIFHRVTVSKCLPSVARSSYSRCSNSYLFNNLNPVYNLTTDFLIKTILLCRCF